MINNGVLVFVTALLLALAIDHFLGEPPLRLHPVVWMGNYLNWAANRLKPNPAPAVRDLKSFWLAALYWKGGAALVLIVSSAAQWAALQLPWYAALVVLGVALKPMLAWSMLRSEVTAVEAALSVSAHAGRQRLAMLAVTLQILASLKYEKVPLNRWPRTSMTR